MLTNEPTIAPVAQLPRRRIRRFATCVGCGTPLRCDQPHGRCATCREGLSVHRAGKARRPRTGSWAARALSEQLADAA